MERNLAYSVLGPPGDDNTERPFLPVGKARQYFADIMKLNALLEDLYYPDDLLVDPDIVLQDYTLVLCTLISCGEGKRLPAFVRLKMSDKDLPLTEYAEIWSKIMTDETTQQIFANKFVARQWQFCIPIFDSSLLSGSFFTSSAILPIVRKEKLELFPAPTFDDDDDGDAKDEGEYYPRTSFRIWLHGSCNKLVDGENKTVGYTLYSLGSSKFIMLAPLLTFAALERRLS